MQHSTHLHNLRASTIFCENNPRKWKAPSYISALPQNNPNVVASPRSLALLGCTGSIGCSTLSLLENLQPEEAALFEVTALAAGKNINLLAKQASRHRPAFLAVQSEGLIAPLKELLPTGYNPQILAGEEGYKTLASLPEVHLVLSAQVGAAGLAGTLAAVRAGKIVALANKESLVLAGELIRDLCAQSGAIVLPVDSEHNAIFQALMERMRPEPAQILLTASGGPFRGYTTEELLNITPEQALKHPNWSMGAKISIDSATLMNKGLEVIEAYHLYGLPLPQIKVVLHPQSVVHSAVCFIDGSIIAELGTTDMRMPIAHSFAWPNRICTPVPVMELTKERPLTFEEPDTKTFPCLALAVFALLHGKGLPIVLNAANEIAVEAFLKRELAFLCIPDLIEACMEKLCGYNTSSGASGYEEEEILHWDSQARDLARSLVKNFRA